MQWRQRGIANSTFNNDAYSVSVSADGSVVAIGAPYNDGINGTYSGHVRVYAWDSTSDNYVQRGADIDGEAAYDYSGRAVSLSADGSVVAIGAPSNNGNFYNSGHVRVYAWNSTSNNYVQRGADIDGESEYDEFGNSVSLSVDGSVVAIGAPLNDGINGTDSGHVRVYAWDSTSDNYVQRGADIDGESEYDYSGRRSVSLSADGSVVAIGAPYNDANINDDNWNNYGHVRVYAWDSTSNIYVQRGADIDGEAAYDESGLSVSLSADGTVVAIGAIWNDGITGTYSGHVRVYAWDSTSNIYVQRGADIDGESEYDYSGWSVSLSADGSVVAIDARANYGHVRVYAWDSTSNIYVQRGADIDGESEYDNSGRSVSLSADGTVVAIGAEYGTPRVYVWGN
jgi:hypothetical protein